MGSYFGVYIFLGRLLMTFALFLCLLSLNLEANPFLSISHPFLRFIPYLLVTGVESKVKWLERKMANMSDAEKNRNRALKAFLVLKAFSSFRYLWMKRNTCSAPSP